MSVGDGAQEGLQSQGQPRVNHECHLNLDHTGSSCFNHQRLGVGKMAPWVKALAVKPTDLTSIPGTHTVEGQNQLLQVVL